MSGQQGSSGQKKDNEPTKQEKKAQKLALQKAAKKKRIAALKLKKETPEEAPEGQEQPGPSRLPLTHINLPHSLETSPQVTSDSDDEHLLTPALEYLKNLDMSQEDPALYDQAGIQEVEEVGNATQMKRRQLEENTRTDGEEVQRVEVQNVQPVASHQDTLDRAAAESMMVFKAQDKQQLNKPLSFKAGDDFLTDFNNADLNRTMCWRQNMVLEKSEDSPGDSIPEEPNMAQGRPALENVPHIQLIPTADPIDNDKNEKDKLKRGRIGKKAKKVEEKQLVEKNDINTQDVDAIMAMMCFEEELEKTSPTSSKKKQQHNKQSPGTSKKKKKQQEPGPSNQHVEEDYTLQPSSNEENDKPSSEDRTPAARAVEEGVAKLEPLHVHTSSVDTEDTEDADLNADDFTPVQHNQKRRRSDHGSTSNLSQTSKAASSPTAAHFPERNFSPYSPRDSPSRQQYAHHNNYQQYRYDREHNYQSRYDHGHRYEHRPDREGFKRPHSNLQLPLSSDVNTNHTADKQKTPDVTSMDFPPLPKVQQAGNAGLGNGRPSAWKGEKPAFMKKAEALVDVIPLESVQNGVGDKKEVANHVKRSSTISSQSDESSEQAEEDAEKRDVAEKTETDHQRSTVTPTKEDPLPAPQEAQVQKVVPNNHQVPVIVNNFDVPPPPIHYPPPQPQVLHHFAPPAPISALPALAPVSLPFKFFDIENYKEHRKKFDYTPEGPYNSQPSSIYAAGSNAARLALLVTPDDLADLFAGKSTPRLREAFGEINFTHSPGTGIAGTGLSEIDLNMRTSADNSMLYSELVGKLYYCDYFHMEKKLQEAETTRNASRLKLGSHEIPKAVENILQQAEHDESLTKAEKALITSVLKYNVNDTDQLLADTTDGEDPAYPKANHINKLMTYCVKENGFTVFHLLCGSITTSQCRSVKTLLEKVPSQMITKWLSMIDFKYKRTPLHFASIRSFSSMILILYSHLTNAILNAKDSTGQAALDYAVRRNNVEILRLLQWAGADMLASPQSVESRNSASAYWGERQIAFGNALGAWLTNACGGSFHFQKPISNVLFFRFEQGQEISAHFAVNPHHIGDQNCFVAIQPFKYNNFDLHMTGQHPHMVSTNLSSKKDLISELRVIENGVSTAITKVSSVNTLPTFSGAFVYLMKPPHGSKLTVQFNIDPNGSVNARKATGLLLAVQIWAAHPLPPVAREPEPPLMPFPTSAPMQHPNPYMHPQIITQQMMFGVPLYRPATQQLPGYNYPIQPYQNVNFPRFPNVPHGGPHHSYTPGPQNNTLYPNTGRPGQYPPN